MEKQQIRQEKPDVHVNSKCFALKRKQHQFPLKSSFTDN